MAKFRVNVIMETDLYLDIEAENIDEAWDIAREADGADFKENCCGGGAWNVTSVEPLDDGACGLSWADLAKNHIHTGMDQDALYAELEVLDALPMPQDQYGSIADQVENAVRVKLGFEAFCIQHGLDKAAPA